MRNEMSYAGARFSAPIARCRRFTSRVLQYVQHTRLQHPLRLLDIGCGTGLQIFDLAEALPHAQLTGVDISEVNIGLAEEARKHSPFGERIQFVAKDYMEFKTTPCDIIISYSTLHLIPVASEDLFHKIMSDLVPGGILLNTMPYGCMYNYWLCRIRRLLKAIRSPVTDALIFDVARMLHGRAMHERQLRERIPYMYLLPERFDGPELRQLLKVHCNLTVIGEHEEIHASVGQLKHRLTVFRKS